MGVYGDTTGLDDQPDRVDRVGHVVAYVVGAVVAEPPDERLVAVRHGPAGHERVGDVRPSLGGTVRHLGGHLLVGDRNAVRSHLLDHPPQPAHPRLAGVADLGGEARMVGVDEVAEQVDRPAVAGAGDLHPAEEALRQADERVAVAPRRVRVTVLVGEPVVLAVVGHPADHRALDRHRAEDREHHLDRAVGLERLVREEAVVADGDPVQGERVHHHRDDDVAPAQPAAPGNRDSAQERDERQSDERRQGDPFLDRLAIGPERRPLERRLRRVFGLIDRGHGSRLRRFEPGSRRPPPEPVNPS